MCALPLTPSPTPLHTDFMILVVDKEQSGEPMDMVTIVMTFDNGKADQVSASASLLLGCLALLSLC